MSYNVLERLLKPRTPVPYREGQEPAHYSPFINQWKDYVWNGGLKTTLFGTKKEIENASEKSVYSDWVIQDLTVNAAIDITFTWMVSMAYFRDEPWTYMDYLRDYMPIIPPPLYIGMVDFALRGLIRKPKKGKPRFGPGIVGTTREALELVYKKIKNGKIN